MPTIGETIPGFGSTPWYGLFAPAGTPKPIVAQLQAEVAKALDDGTVKDKLAPWAASRSRARPSSSPR